MISGEGNGSREESKRWSEREFTCPITQELMREPVVCADGHTYERVALQRWFSTGNTRSPVTNEVLESRAMFPNHSIKRLILAFQTEQSAKLIEYCKSTQDTLETFRAKVVSFLDSGALIDSRDKHGDSPLMHTLRQGKGLQAQVLLELGSSVSGENDQGESCQSLCSHSGLSKALEAQITAQLHVEVQRKEAERKEREELQSQFRQEQEERRQRVERNNVMMSGIQSASLLSNAMNNGTGAVTQMMRNSWGFFPSLFGLQFQNLEERGTNRRGRRTRGEWMLGNVLISEEDADQHHFLSNMLLTIGVVLFCLCFML